jgi:hypothetical protein
MVGPLFGVDASTKASIDQAPIGIVGGGPVGMMLALFLARYGVRSVVFEADPQHAVVSQGQHSSRTMEPADSGVAAAIRGFGAPSDHPTDLAYFTRYHGWELARLKMPSQRMAMVVACSLMDQIREPIHRARSSSTPYSTSTSVVRRSSRAASGGGPQASRRRAARSRASQLLLEMLQKSAGTLFHTVRCHR